MKQKHLEDFCPLANECVDYSKSRICKEDYVNCKLYQKVSQYRRDIFERIRQRKIRELLNKQATMGGFKLRKYLL